MTDAITILALRESAPKFFQRCPARAAAAAAPRLHGGDRLHQGIPLYDGDVEEATGVPEVVETLKERVAVADGLLLVTPEYNNRDSWRVQERYRLAVTTPAGHSTRVRWTSCSPHGSDARVWGRCTPRPPGCQCCASWVMQPWFGASL